MVARRSFVALSPLLELGEPLVDFTDQMAYRDVQQLFDAVLELWNFGGATAEVDAARPRSAIPRRLAAIKRRYDPTNMFRFNQNIQPAT